MKVGDLITLDEREAFGSIDSIFMIKNVFLNYIKKQV